ncbi:MAG: lecithin retinol acyltransferase family protein [Fibrobacteraceae bacterium]
MIIDESKLPEPPIGAHLESPRTGFNHHGLYIGGGKVIHYSGMARTLSTDDILKLPGLIRYGCIVKTSMKRFCDGHGFRVVEHPHAKFSGEAAVARAKKRLYERSYYLYGNNCEHFVNWCLDDTFKSPTVTKILVGFALVGFLIHAFGISRLGKNMPAWARFIFGTMFAIVGAFIITHFTTDALQPADGIRGRERRNRYLGRVGAWIGFCLAVIFAVIGIGRKSRIFESFSIYFIPLACGLGSYAICRSNDAYERDQLREQRKKTAEEVPST